MNWRSSNNALKPDEVRDGYENAALAVSAVFDGRRVGYGCVCILPRNIAAVA